MTERITKQLYNGAVTIEHWPESHRYKLAGERTYLISVTAVTGMLDKSRPLIIWATRLTGDYLRRFLDKNTGQKFSAEELYPIIDEAVDQHNKKKEEAGNIGDIVHDFAEKFAKGEVHEVPNDLPEEARNAISQFLDWVIANKVVFIEAERFVYSKKYGYCGKFDAVVEIKGKKYLVDYKTSNSVYDEHRYQTSAYLGAFEEETGIKLDGIMIIPFSKETGIMQEPEFIDRPFYSKIYKAFVSLYKVKVWQKEMDKLTGKWGSYN